MGNTNCCQPRDPKATDFGNLDTINKENLESAQDGYRDTHIGLINNRISEVPKEEEESIPAKRSVAQVEGQIQNENDYEPMKVQGSRNGPPQIEKKTTYNPEKSNFDEQIFDISDEASDTIFNLFNEMRINPEQFLNDSIDHGLKLVFDQAVAAKQKPIMLIKDEMYYYVIREELLTLNYTPRPIEDLIEDIKKMPELESFDIQIYHTQTTLDNYSESIWNILKHNKDIAFTELLNNHMDYCVICAMPVRDGNMKVFLVVLNKK